MDSHIWQPMAFNPEGLVYIPAHRGVLVQNDRTAFVRGRWNLGRDWL
jgi:hypothetical protein